MWRRCVSAVGRPFPRSCRQIEASISRNMASVKWSSGKDPDEDDKARTLLGKVLRQRNWEAQQLFGPILHQRTKPERDDAQSAGSGHDRGSAPDATLVTVRVRESGYRDLDAGSTANVSREVRVNRSDIEHEVENSQSGRFSQVVESPGITSGNSSITSGIRSGTSSIPSSITTGIRAGTSSIPSSTSGIRSGTPSVRSAQLRAPFVPTRRLDTSDSASADPKSPSSLLSETLPLERLCLFPLTAEGNHDMVRSVVEDGLERFWATRANLSATSSFSQPSVSVVLQKSMSPESLAALERWKAQMVQELGMDGFLRYQEETFAVGSQLHRSIAQHVSGQPLAAEDVDKRIVNHWKSLQQVFPDISEASLLEQRVQHPVLRYRGIFDCVAKYRGATVLIEWKTSQKPKSQLQFTYDNPLQVAAYIGALNFSGQLESQITRAAIVIAYSSGAPATLHYLNEELCRKYWILWLHRFHKYLSLVD